VSLSTIYSVACEHPSKTAVIHNGITISYSAFANAVSTTIDFIDTQDFSEGTNVIVIVKDLLNCWVAVLALQARGFTTIVASSSEFVSTLKIRNIAGIVTTTDESSIHQLNEESIAGMKVIFIPSPAYRDDQFSGDMANKGSIRNGDHILYTSGTTGDYKKIVFAAQHQQKRDAERVQQMSLQEDTVFHCLNYALWTSIGYTLPLSTWHANGCVILDQRPDWYKYFMHSGVTRAVLLPDRLIELLGSTDDCSEVCPLENLTLHASGGFISRKIADKILGRITRNLVVSYGSTEVCIASLESMATNLDDLHWLAPTHYRRIEIVDESGAGCPFNVEGYLRIRLQEHDCASYLEDPEASARVFKEGYFYPGDMAIQRPDGRVRLLGRSADVVNFRGQKLAASPIEERIQNILDGTNTCIFSGINDVGEDQVVIVMESKQWPEKSRLDHLGSEFREFDQVLFSIVYPFPRTQTGIEKINRTALRKLVFSSQ